MLFCIIPALNEELNLEKVLKEAVKYADCLVVVDDGSSDRTPNIAAAAGAVVLSHPVNRGQGAALETGDEYARRHGADIVVHFDADGQFSASEIIEVAAPIKSGEADAVFGSRFSGKSNNIPFMKRAVIIPIARLVNRFFFGLKMRDPQSGFRAFSKKALETIRIEQSGMAHCSEILHQAAKSGLRIKEVPISVHYPDFGQNFFGGVRIVKDTIIGKLMD
jgi:polyprenyl-phospho-N-acetylgalactosaminyl synthase